MWKTEPNKCRGKCSSLIRSSVVLVQELPLCGSCRLSLESLESECHLLWTASELARASNQEGSPSGKI